MKKKLNVIFGNETLSAFDDSISSFCIELKAELDVVLKEVEVKVLIDYSASDDIIEVFDPADEKLKNDAIRAIDVVIAEWTN